MTKSQIFRIAHRNAHLYLDDVYCDYRDVFRVALLEAYALAKAVQNNLESSSVIVVDSTGDITAYYSLDEYWKDCDEQ